jgi:hypothetical protein
MSIDTLANVKTRLGVTTSADDSLLTLLMNSADKYVSNYCGRDFGGGTYTEYHPGGSEFVHLRNFPVQGVTSVNVDPGYVFGSSTILSPTSYVVHSERGVIQSLVGPFAPRVDRQGLVNRHVYNWTKGPRVIQVIYTVATGAVDDPVLEAYAQLVGHWYRRVKTQAAAAFLNISEQKFGDATAAYTPAQIAGLPIPPDVALLLAPYRVPNV